MVTGLLNDLFDMHGRNFIQECIFAFVLFILPSDHQNRLLAPSETTLRMVQASVQ